MSFPASGQISLNDINVAYGNPTGTQISLGNFPTSLLCGSSGNVQTSVNGAHFTQSSTNQSTIIIDPSTFGPIAPQVGYSSALSADGNTLVFGNNSNNSQLGIVYVYVRTGTTWTLQQTLLGSGGIGTTLVQGYSVSISADGNTIAAGAIGDNSNIGCVWIFTRSGTTWTQQAKIIPIGYIGSSIDAGYSVSLSADGNTLAFGGIADNTQIGAVWVFTRSGTTWSQQIKLVPPDYQFFGTGQIGQNVSLSADGNTLAFGSVYDIQATGSHATPRDGATWVYTRSGTTWSEVTKILPPSGQKSFGAGVKLNAKGNLLFVVSGTPLINYYVNTGTWTWSGSFNAWFGFSLPATQFDISADGSILAAFDSNSTYGQLFLMLYTNNSGTWSVKSNTSLGQPGTAGKITLSPNGDTLVTTYSLNSFSSNGVIVLV